MNDVYFLNICAVNWSSFGVVIAIALGLAVVFSALILTVLKFCSVKEDKKADEIADHLAGANCGGCGFNGCKDFAAALLEGKADLDACNATSKENKIKIAEILGVSVADEGEKAVCVFCSGGENAKDKFIYVGENSCRQKAALLSGSKICDFGCLGEGDCVNACPYNAIKLVNGVAKIDFYKCRACGACVKACPKNLPNFIPKTAKIYVACSNHCKGKAVLDACKNGCIGCGMCARVCPEGAIVMENDLPKIDYSKCKNCFTCLLKCPRKCIKTFPTEK